MSNTIYLNSNNEKSIVSIYLAECLEQPQRLAELFHAYACDPVIRNQLGTLKKVISADLPLLWLGMGASYCSSLSGATKLSLLGRASFAVEASEWLHYAIGAQRQVGGPILVTTSGESVELVELCQQNQAKPSVLVCNNSQSPCWSAAQIRLPILAGPELANATKTYTNSTAVCTIIGSELAGYAWQPESDQVIESFAKSLANVFQRRREIEEFCRGATTIEVIGRGATLGGAVMGAVCLREMTGIRAGAQSGGGFRHGSLLDVDSTHVAIILALGRTAELAIRLAEDCVSRGGRVILVQSDLYNRSERLLPIDLEVVPEPWESLTSVLVPQALTLALIERLGSKYVRLQTTTQ
jgi:glucosamine--fructose-6-phosphate aminotransferase (isomerizing)